MKEGTVLLAALVATAGIVWWSGEQPAPVAPGAAKASVEQPEPDVPATQPAPFPEARRPPAPPVAGPHQAYRCRRGGDLSFSDRPCAADEQQEIITLHAQPPGTPTASYREQYERLAVSRPRLGAVAPAAAHRPDESELRAAECERLWESIRALDAQARLPQGARMQDWLLGQRRAASDRRFSLGC